MFYAIVTLLTLVSNHQGTEYRRKEEKNRHRATRGLRAASAPWGAEMKINPMYYWSMWNSWTRINILHLQWRKRKKSIFIVYLSSSSEKYLCEPLGWKCWFHWIWLFQGHTFGESVAPNSHIQEAMCLPCLLSDPFLGHHWVNKTV